MTRKITIVALSILMALSLLPISLTRGQERNNTRPIENQQAMPVTDVGREAEVISSAADKTIKLASQEEIEGLIENLANGQPVVVKMRMLVAGEMIESNQATIEVQRESALYDPDSKSLVIKGLLYGEAVVEDVRFLEFKERFYVLRDIYPDNADLNLSLGRGTPVSLDDEAESSAQSSSLLAAPAAAVAAAAPVINSISGTTNSSAGITNGLVDMSCGTAYNGGRVVNDKTDAYHWVINGSNFGSTSGSVTLAGRAVQIVQNGWSPTRIEIMPTVPYTWGPMSTTLTISTSNGTINRGVSIVPSVSTRIFLQCTYHVAVTRLNMGKLPSPSAYDGYPSITPSYVPQRGDQVQFYKLTNSSNKHAAIFTGVSGPTQVNGVTKWTLTVSEMNYDCKHSTRSYTTTFEVKNGQVLQYPKSSISGYSDCRVYYR